MRRLLSLESRKQNVGGCALGLVVLGGLLLFGEYIGQSLAASDGANAEAGGVPGQQAGFASIPLEINHQGVVAVDGIRFNGDGDFRFAIVDIDDNNLWTNDGSSLNTPGIPATAVSLTVAKGIYSVRLGDAALLNMVEIPPTVFDDGNVRLRIWFDDTQGNGIQELTPPHVLTSVPYSFRTRIPSGVIVMWFGLVVDIPSGWGICDGTMGTPDLTDRFPVGAGGFYDLGSSGGSEAHTHEAGTLAAAEHAHPFSGTVSYQAINRDGGTSNVARNNVTDHGHTYSGTTEVGGGGLVTGTSSEASNLPPFRALHFIMKL